MKTKPMIGQSVYYKSRGSMDGVFPPTDRAAIITDIKEIISSGVNIGEFEVRLCVMNPEGLFFTAWLKQGQAPGNWEYAYNSGMSSGN